MSDTGIGIPAEEHESIFDKFHQVGATTKGVREGTGLGLAITSAWWSSMAAVLGRERAESRQPFTFTIPVQGRAKGRDEENTGGR